MPQTILTKDQVTSISQRPLFSSAVQETATSVAKEFGATEKNYPRHLEGRTCYEQNFPLNFKRLWTKWRGTKCLSGQSGVWTVISDRIKP